MNNEREVMIPDSQRTRCEIWTRPKSVMGYHRPVTCWNKGKQSEWKQRKFFKESVTLNTLLKRYKEAS